MSEHRWGGRSRLVLAPRKQGGRCIGARGGAFRACRMSFPTGGTRPAAALLAAAVLLSPGCAGEDDSGPWGGSVDTLSSGTVIVHNPREVSVPLDSLWKVEVLARIGAREGTGPDVFGSVTDFALDSHGRVWVLDGQARQVRVFSGRGEFVRSVGRGGEGPGELEEPIGLAASPDGEIWVVDRGATRLTVFDTAGRYLGSHRRKSAGYHTALRGKFDREGRFYDLVHTAEDWRILRQRERTSGAERALETLDTVPLPERPGGPERYELRLPGGVRYRAQVPFTPQAAWALGPEGDLWYSPQAPYRVYRLTAEHDTLRIVEREYEPVAVTEADREQALQELDWFRERGGKVDPGRIPDEKPGIHRLFVDEVGHLWVQPYRPHGEPNRSFDVFDPAGRYLGRLTLPVAIEMTPEPVVAEDRIVALQQDELGVPFVVVTRLERSGSTKRRGAESVTARGESSP